MTKTQNGQFGSGGPLYVLQVKKLVPGTNDRKIVHEELDQYW